MRIFGILPCLAAASLLHAGWEQHSHLGWIFSAESAPEIAYDPEIGWFYQPQDHPEYLYRYESASWTALYEDSGNPGWGIDLTGGELRRLDLPMPASTILTHHNLEACTVLVEETSSEISDIWRYPIQIQEGETAWTTVKPSNWTAGFWPGILWMVSDYAEDPDLRLDAINWNAGLESQKNNTGTHDLGFMLFNSFGKALRFTNNPQYEDILLTAAASLASRYDEDVGAIRSWSWGKWDDDTNFTVIIDNMVNLELLLWAGRHPNGDPLWRDMAISHARLTAVELMRADDSFYHTVIFDENTGEVLEKTTHQGYSDSSAWARGQAWAIYGFTVMYRETGLPEFLDVTKRATAFFLANLPEDRVPVWDFRVPSPETEPRDSSAAAITASGLFELSSLVDDPEERDFYFNQAHQILEALSLDDYFNRDGSAGNAMLLHGTYNRKADNLDTPLIWGDYYFVEAKRRFLSLNNEYSRKLFFEYDGCFVIDAESAPRLGGWRFEEDPGSLGAGFYRWAGPESLTASDLPVLEYDLQLLSSGSYRFISHTLTEAVENPLSGPLFWFQVMPEDANGQFTSTDDWSGAFIDGPPGWTWEVHSDSGQAIHLDLSKGRYRLRISPAQAGLGLDRLVLFLETRDPPDVDIIEGGESFGIPFDAN